MTYLSGNSWSWSSRQQSFRETPSPWRSGVVASAILPSDSSLSLAQPDQTLVAVQLSLTNYCTQERFFLANMVECIVGAGGSESFAPQTLRAFRGLTKSPAWSADIDPLFHNLNVREETLKLCWDSFRWK